jgi:hypothetical protein
VRVSDERGERRELNERFGTMTRRGIGGYVDRYHHRPHSGLGHRTPDEVRRTWEDGRLQKPRPELSTPTGSRSSGAGKTEPGRAGLVNRPHRAGQPLEERHHLLRRHPQLADTKLLWERRAPPRASATRAHQRPTSV